MEQVEFEIQANENILEIIPTEIKDSSTYSIKISGLKSADGTKVYPDQIFKITTAVSPAYCTLDSLKSLADSFGIDDQTMLTYIVEASNFADFVATATTSNAKGNTLVYAKSELTKVKAALDCLTSGYIGGTFLSGGNRYKLGEDELEEGDRAAAFKNLLDWLKWLLRYWMDAVRGYLNPGHAKPKATRLGIKASENTDVSQITVDSLIDDYNRNFIQWS